MTHDELIYQIRSAIDSGGASEAMKETLRGCLAALEVTVSAERMREAAILAVDNSLRQFPENDTARRTAIHAIRSLSIEEPKP